MSIRIFNLAKQLRKDNKDVIEACQKVGIVKKNPIISLTSITQDEAALVKKYLEERDAKASDEKKSASQSILELDASMTPLPPSKMGSGSSTGKVKLIVPARGNISAVDPAFRRVPTVPKRSDSETTAPEKGDEPSTAQTTPTEQPIAKQPASESNPPVEQTQNAEPTSAPESVAPATNDGVHTTETVAPETVVKAQTEREETDESPIEKSKMTEAQPTSNKTADAEAVATPSADSVSTRVESDATVDSSKSDAAAISPNAEPSASVVPASSSDERAQVSSHAQTDPNAPQTGDGRKSPLRAALDRRGGASREGAAATRDDARRRGRERERDRSKDSGRRSGVAKGSEPRPSRPAPISSAYIAQLAQSAQSLSEMQRPAPATTQNHDRVRVLGQPSKSKREDSSADSSNASKSSSASKTNLSLHLAPMPTLTPKPTKQATPKEPAPQKPERRLSPEALRAAASGRPIASGPLASRLRSASQGSTGSVSRNDRRSESGGAGRDDRSNASRSGASRTDFGGGDSRNHKRGNRDRNENEGRDAKRSGVTRRAGNDSLRLLRGDARDIVEDGRYATRAHKNKSARRDKNSASTVTAPRKSDVVIEFPCTAKQFAEATGISVAAVMKKMMELGYMFNMNRTLEKEVVELLIEAFEIKASIKQEATLEEQYVDAYYEEVDPPESLVPRAPVVTFLGHVDHGKTSLLDRILNLHVVSGEKGGITQHIRAYRVDSEAGAVTFVDTPGHEAFTEMRARGANCTDIAVLVVAADDGVMPQTEEAISHAKAAGVPIIVALNKMDLPGVNRDKVIQELANNDLMPAEWGGDVEIVETSAITGMGVDKLLETILMVAELHELKANPNRAATGVVLESALQSGEGVVCKALVQNGTLRNGDVVLCGSSYGRVRAMTDTLNERKRMKEAGPSVPVSLYGLDTPPDAGSRFVVLDDVSIARQIAEDRAKRSRELELAGSESHVTLENLFDRMKKGVQTLNIIIRADVRGSIEAIRKELGKLEHSEVKVKILQATVGGVTEADVQLAVASDAVIVGFNVVPDERARSLAEQKKVQIRRYDVIYKLTEDIRQALEGMLKPIEQVKELGRATVLRVFNISRVGSIAGCRVIHGSLERDCQIRVIRDSRVIGEYLLETLKREKDDAKEVREGYECGVKLKNYNDVKEGDVLEAYKIEEIARTFD